jgi:hypothetical protein
VWAVAPGRLHDKVPPPMRLRLAAMLLLFVGAACRPAPNLPVDAGSTAAPPDAGTPLPPLTIDLEMLLPDGGVERSALLGLETPHITPGQSLAVESNRRLHNARIRILDEADRALASDDVPEDGPLGLRYRIGLLAPLEPGRRYAVLIDPQSGATLDDGTGRELPEQRLEFQTTGERQRPKPPPTTHRKRRRE